MRAAERPRPPQAAGRALLGPMGGQRAGPLRGQVAPPGAARAGRGLAAGPGPQPRVPRTQQERDSKAPCFVCAASA